MNKIKLILIFIFFVGAGIRLIDVWRPINRASWRECDLGAVSRNYARESMNPFYPRIDWRGTTPGYAEMEFPLYPYLTAITYKLFGVHDYFGRVWAFHRDHISNRTLPPPRSLPNQLAPELPAGPNQSGPKPVEE